jgi:hypothetical protein
MRGNKTKIDAFVGPQRDLGSETVISAIYNGLSVQQALLPLAKPDNLPLFLGGQFGSNYLALKGKGINITVQHGLPAVSANVAGQFENLVQLADTVQGIVELYGGIYATPGTPIGDEDPLFFHDLPRSRGAGFGFYRAKGCRIGYPQLFRRVTLPRTARRALIHRSSVQ